MVERRFSDGSHMVEHLREELGINIASAEHGSDATSSGGAVLQESGQADGTGSFGDVMGICKVNAHGLFDLVVGYLKDAIGTGADDLDGICGGLSAGHTVGDTGRSGLLDDLAGSDRTRECGRVGGDDTDDARPEAEGIADSDHAADA